MFAKIVLGDSCKKNRHTGFDAEGTCGGKQMFTILLIAGMRKAINHCIYVTI